MNFFKDYKGVALICLGLTIVNIFWILSYDRPEKISKVKVQDKTILKI